MLVRGLKKPNTLENKLFMRTRFAPSPTGYLHLGNIRTALFNYLLACHKQGEFLLRVEDTDQLRSAEAFTQQLQDDLQWLGLNWQGDMRQASVPRPYFQSQRQLIYVDYYEQLQRTGAAYACFCTEIELVRQREQQRAQGKPSRYKGTCRDLSAKEIAHKQSQGLQPSLRFRVPSHERLIFQDWIKGAQSFASDHFGDFVIRRADGTPGFLFCNALDDALMGVTHVLRGEDHLSNTPRQRLLLQALGLAVPLYGHLPLITGTDAVPLSKRAGSFSVKALREMGYLPIAICNYLSRLGHTYDDHSLMTLEQLAANFSVDRLHTAPAHFDESQLYFWQKQAIQKLDSVTFWSCLDQSIQELIPVAVRQDFIEVIRPLVLFPAEVHAWAQVLFVDPLQLDAEVQVIVKAADPQLWPVVRQIVQVNFSDKAALSKALKACFNHYPAAVRKAGWQALRLALTGCLAGPELVDVIQLIGCERACRRLERP